MAPKRKLTHHSSIKFETGESLKSLGLKTPNSTIPSPLAFLEVLKNWFENHTDFSQWIDIFEHRSLSFVDFLDYNFFLFKDFEVAFSFI
jgi:predicted component of type VI protein secretion system